MLSQNRGEMISRNFWFWVLNIGAFVFSHESRQHGDYSFKDLREAVNGDYLTPEEQQTLFNSLHLLNCNETKNELDYRKCFTTNDLHEFEGSSASRGLNSTEFTDISPVIIYCLLPTSSQKNLVGEPCDISRKSHEQIFEAFVSNFSKGQEGISYKGLETILKQINHTVGQFFTKKKCFSADSIIKEVLKEEGNTLDQNEFKRACASIILHLVQGYCIGQNETLKKLPSKAFFINDIFMHKSHLSREDFHEIIKSLGIGETSSESTAHDHGHHHRRRRSTTAALLPRKELVSSHAVYRREIDPHGNQVDAHQTSGTCYSLDDLLTIFDVDHSTGADRDDFQNLCPAFIQQAKSGACSSGQSNRKPATVDRNPAKIWGYGIGAVTLISLTSLAGVATIPFIGKRLYNKVLDLLVGLAVGSLAGDGLLHLLPHSFGLHAHEEEESTGDSHDHSEDHAFIWKAMVVLASIYVFYLFEILTHLGLKSKFLGLSRHELKPEEQLRKGKTEIPKDNKDIVLMNASSKDVQDVIQSDKGDHENERVGASLQPRSSASSKKNSWKNISAVAWMIIIGDSLHNISDGLAIGAVFSQGGPSGISGGISTSIAVFCHELPHELGDFAVLLKAGMSVKMALVANFLSALSCFIGLFIGIEVGQQGEVRLWFFAIAGGIFLYVALVDMLPHLIHSKTLKAEPLVTFLLQNVGLLVGFGILLIIALYEENLKGLKF